MPDVPRILDFAPAPSASEPRKANAPAAEAPPPPPPPSAPAAQPAAAASTMPPPPPAPAAAAAQPPPPPAAAQAQQPPPPPAAPKSPAKPAAPPARMNLLAAIRNKDNMKKLKSKSEAKQRDQALQKKKPEVAKPLSMAEEMRMKLVRRQKLLSGARDDEEQAAARERKKRMSAGVNVVSFVGKLKKRASAEDGSPRSRTKKRMEDASAGQSQGPFSMKGMSGLDAKLQHLSSRNRSGTYSSDDDSEDDW